MKFYFDSLQSRMEMREHSGQQFGGNDMHLTHERSVWFTIRKRWESRDQ